MLKNIVYNIIEKLAGNTDEISAYVEEVRASFPNLKRDRLAVKVGTNIQLKGALRGGIFAIPGSVPGLGTAIQAGISSFDFSHLIRNQVYMIFAISYCYGIKDTDLIKKAAIECIGKSLNIFDKDEMKGKMGNKLGKKIADQATKIIISKLRKKLTKKFISNLIIKLIPFGIGIAIGTVSHWQTLQRTKRTAIAYFKESNLH